MKCVSKAIVVSCCLFSFSGCGPSGNINAERKSGLELGLTQPVVTDSDVRLVTENLGIEGETVSGTSCQNKVWDKLPTNERAILLMKQQAAGIGYNAIHNIHVKEVDVSISLAHNCWKSITAIGIGFNENASKSAL